MTLEELKAQVTAENRTKMEAHIAEVNRRKLVILAHLDAIGIKEVDGWVITPEPPTTHGIKVSHPQLPGVATIVLAGDGTNAVYIQVGFTTFTSTTIRHILEQLGATL